MKHWDTDTKNSNSFYHEKGIFLRDAEGDYRVLGITLGDDGSLYFSEGCDEYFSVKKTKDEAIEALQEAIDYIKSLK